MVQGMVAEEPPAKPDVVVAEVKARKAEWGLEDLDVGKVGGCCLACSASRCSREGRVGAGGPGWRQVGVGAACCTYGCITEV